MGVSSPFWGNLFDKYGRKIVSPTWAFFTHDLLMFVPDLMLISCLSPLDQGLMLSMTWTLYYGLLSAFAQVYGWLLFLRGLVGFGLGGAPQA